MKNVDQVAQKVLSSGKKQKGGSSDKIGKKRRKPSAIRYKNENRREKNKARKAAKRAKKFAAR